MIRCATPLNDNSFPLRSPDVGTFQEMPTSGGKADRPKRSNQTRRTAVLQEPRLSVNVAETTAIGYQPIFATQSAPSGDWESLLFRRYKKRAGRSARRPNCHLMIHFGHWACR